MLDKLKAAAATIAITVVAGSLTAVIGFYAGLFYQSAIPISAEATIVTLPNPVISKYSFENSPPKPISDLMKTLPPVLQGAALINNTFQVLQIDIKNNSDVRSEKLELLVPDNTATGYYLEINKPTLVANGPINLGTLNPGETMHVATMGLFIGSEEQVSLLLNGKKVSIDGPLDKKRLGVVPYLAVKYPSVFSLLLVICVVVLAVTLLEAIQEWRFSRDKALWAKHITIEKLQQYRSLLDYVQESNPGKYAASAPEAKAGAPNT